MSSSKRADLQGIRGLAILAVLLFHFFPECIPNGYVGVDQFFILSGYLMAKILSKETSISFTVLYDFYYRRMKRILPLYALFILTTISMCLWLFPSGTFEFNYPYAVSSLAFISNRDIGDAGMDYQRMLLNAQILFTHTWSLSTEVQFYIVAPFLILIALYMPVKLYLGFIGVLGAVSCFFFNYLMQSETTQSISFNSMPTRIWQFLLGVLCCTLAKIPTSKVNEKMPLPRIEDRQVIQINEETEKTSQFSWTLASSVTILCSSLVAFYPWNVQEGLVRFLVCFQTASLIFCGRNYASRLLSNPIIVYLGDISYSLYLIHWPVYVYIKQYYANSIEALLIGITVSIVAAILTYEIYEKFYQKQSEKVIIPLCILLYLINFGVIFYFKPETVHIENMEITHHLFRVPENLTREEVYKINKWFDISDQAIMDYTYNLSSNHHKYFYKKLEHATGFGTFENLTYSGKKRIMLLGNSWAMNFARMIIENEDCLAHASEISVMFRYSCPVFDVHKKNVFCPGHQENYIQTVERTKPDVLFTLSRFENTKGPINETKDEALEFERKTLLRLRKAVKEKIYILTAVPTLVQDMTSRIDAGMKSGNMPKYEELVDDSSHHEDSRQRMARITSECPKCSIIDIKPTFALNGTIQFYNPENGVAYFNRLRHLTDYGLAKVAPLFSEACRKI